jgi:predicted RNase H-like HicB family nuclease
MLTYKAAYKFLDKAVHGEVLDFPGVITSGNDLDEVRELLAAALVDMAETSILLGEHLPVPDAAIADSEADLEEPIHLILNASSRYSVTPGKQYEAA